MFQQISTTTFFTALAVTIAALAGSRETIAASVKFTAEVPNGVTQLQDIVQFSVANHDKALRVSTGNRCRRDGSGIASSMRTELENFSSFDGTVAGNMLTVKTRPREPTWPTQRLGCRWKSARWGTGVSVVICQTCRTSGTFQVTKSRR